MWGARVFTSAMHRAQACRRIAGGVRMRSVDIARRLADNRAVKAAAIDPSAFALDRFLPYQLSVASEAVSAAVARAYRGRFGLKMSEWRVLAVVAGSARGLQQREVGGATGMDKMTISRAVAALCARALLVRRDDATDRRSARLHVTTEGRQLYDEVVPAARAVEARLLSTLNARDVAALSALLARLRAVAEVVCSEP